MQGRGKGQSVRERVLEKGRRHDPTPESPGAVVLNTIFILLGLRGSYSAAHIFVLDVFDFQLSPDGLT